MRYIKLGKEITNNKRTRYALIIMIKDKITGLSTDNTITFYYSNNLKKLKETRQLLILISQDKTYYIDAELYDYENMEYIKKWGDKKMLEQLKQALQQGNLYDFISNNGWCLSKDSLIEIIKQLDFTIYQNFGEAALKQIERATIDNILDSNETFFEE